MSLLYDEDYQKSSAKITRTYSYKIPNLKNIITNDLHTKKPYSTYPGGPQSQHPPENSRLCTTAVRSERERERASVGFLGARTTAHRLPVC